MKTVLLIEDNDDIRENMAEILELSNYKVVTAPDGKKGIEQAVSQKPDIIVCDIMMPVLDGYGVIHALQKMRVQRTFLSFSSLLRPNDLKFEKAWSLA